MRKTAKSHVSIVLFREEEKWRIASNLWSRQSPIFLGCSRCSNSSARQSHGGEQVKVIVHRESDGGGGGDGEFTPPPPPPAEFSPQFFFFREFFSHALVSERLEKARTSGLVSLVFSRQTGFPVLASVYCYIDVHN